MTRSTGRGSSSNGSVEELRSGVCVPLLVLLAVAVRLMAGNRPEDFRETAEEEGEYSLVLLGKDRVEPRSAVSGEVDSI